MNKKILYLLLAPITLLAVSGCGTTPQPIAQDTTPIKIGFVAPMSGDAAHYGDNMQAALNIAIKEVNDAGGVNGRKLDLLTEDGQCSGKTALNAGNKLIYTDQVPVILSLCSDETLTIAPLAEQNKRLLFAPASTNPKITDAGDYIFRLSVSDNYQGKYVADYIFNKLKKTKVAILYNSDKEWSTGVKEAFKNTFLTLGGQIVDEEGVLSSNNDLRSQIIKIKNSNPELIYFPSFVETGIVGLKQMKELGINVPILGGDVWDDPKIPQTAGVAANGARYTVVSNLQLPQTFIDTMNATPQGQNINNYSPRAYDALKILAQIMQTTGDDPTKIKNELYKLKDYHGIADTYTMDSNGDLTTANFMIKEFENGKIVEVKE